MRQSTLFRRLRWRVWLRRWLPEREWRRTMLWAGLAGLLSALCVEGFREAIHGIQWILTQDTRGILHVARELPPWRRLILPALGGVLSGLVVFVGLGWTGRRGATDYMEALSVGDGVIRARPALLKSLSSLFTIASGGSIGREGAMVQVASTVMSALGRRFRLEVPHLPLLVACGASGAVASAYNAPIAGALFIAEIILGSIAMESFGPLLMASLVSVTVSQQIFGVEPLFGPRDFRLISPGELPWYFILGMILGFAAPGWVRLLRLAEERMGRLPVPLFVRLGLGGLVVGAVSVVVPEVWGNGYEHLKEILVGESARAPAWVVMLIAAKLVATVASVGSGAVGGVLTPSLLLGGLGGLFVGLGVHGLFPEHTGSPQAYALVGMAAFLAATIRAPLTAILLVFEMTLDYDIVLSLMVASVAAYSVARGISPESIYTRSLRRQTDREHRLGAATAMRVADVMRKPPPQVRTGATFEEIARQMSGVAEAQIAVVNADDQLVGSIALPSIETYLREPWLARLVTAEDVVSRDPRPVVSQQRLVEALEQFRHCPGEMLLVVEDTESHRLVGSLAKTDVILCLAHGERLGAGGHEVLRSGSGQG